MLFNDHSRLVGQHAFLSASNYHWINYDEQKLDSRFVSAMAAQRGTDLHEFAQNAIRLKIKLPATRKTINLYVNDAIGFRMTPEPVLFFSVNCFGTPDAIGFSRNKLRIHDLKTGLIRASEHQLEVYAALFCLEYNFSPFDIEIELRIYQRDEVRIFETDADDIMHIMEKIRAFDRRINELRMEAAQ